MRKFLWAGQQKTSFNSAFKNSSKISIFSRQIEHIKFDTGRDWKIIIKKKMWRERRWFFLRYKLYGTCHVSLIVQQQQQRRWRWRQQSVKNAGNGLQGLYNMASTPIFQLRLVCQLMREIFFFFLSFRFAGKFNSCGNSVNLKGAAASTHRNTRTRATPLATRPVCQQGSLYPFDRAA